MASSYYKPCKELTLCEELINKYWNTKEFEKCFEGHKKIADETSYALAECQVGYFYLEGIGTEIDLDKAFEYTKRSAIHGNRDGQFNLAWLYENGQCGIKDLEEMKKWYKAAALQDHDLAIKKCLEIGIDLEN